ncbi:MAG: type II methionyl aminopeptidase [Nanoarchaeota archaeon]|nr:type II methionyl aminopeptidase [Nanoarchaeota archaeon]
MTEKQYGGSTGREGKSLSAKANIQNTPISKTKRKEIPKDNSTSKASKEEKILEAGKIAKKSVDYAKSIIKKDMKLLEIAEKIEEKIIELGGKPAFPVNLSINDIAAHYTPAYNDETLAHGLLKVDLGVHVNGYVADTAFSIDLENNEQNKKLIEASEKALMNAIEIAEENLPLSQIGKTIQETIESLGFTPIINLSGHEMQQYDLHAGLTIPNHDNKSTIKLSKGSFAIEPFATNGSGKVYEGKPSGIYALINWKNVRSETAREVGEFIEKEYQTLPFCSRWLVKEFGTKALFALKQLEENENIHQYPQLIELSHGLVSQAEHTILISKEKIITTN